MSRWSGNGQQWRHEGGKEWPPMWDGASPDKWPRFDTEVWTPDHCGPCVIVCERNSQPMVLVTYETAAAAEQADLALYDRPCGPGCQRMHYRVFTEPRRVRVERGVHDPQPVPPDLAGALWAAGYRRPNGLACPPAQHWPVDPAFNERMHR
jgi:hypothetical protein